jgi:hypothetical protein
MAASRDDRGGKEERLLEILERVRRRGDGEFLPTPPEGAPIPPRPWSDDRDEDADAGGEER